MSGKTKIEWTDIVWNPIRGCTRVSKGCENCYAERQAIRMSGPGGAYEGLVKSTSSGPRWTGQVLCAEEKLQEPFQWKKPRKVFVNSMSDLFHPNSYNVDTIFAVMALTPQHTYQILTKRPERMEEFCGGADTFKEIDENIHIILQNRYPDGEYPPDVEEGYQRWLKNPLPLPNVWLGVSIEDQATADARIPHLLETPAAVRFVSYEPALGAVDLDRLHTTVPGGFADGMERWDSALSGKRFNIWADDDLPYASLDWVIAGGESGPNARPAHPDWFRSLRDQCEGAGVPFFFKQWGEWKPDGNPFDGEDQTQRMARIGKKAAGRLLDGVEHNGMPEVNKTTRSEAK